MSLLVPPSYQVILICLATVAFARPQIGDPDYIYIIRDEMIDDGELNYNFLSKTENGILKDVSGNPTPNSDQTMTGSIR